MLKRRQTEGKKIGKTGAGGVLRAAAPAVREEICAQYSDQRVLNRSRVGGGRAHILDGMPCRLSDFERLRGRWREHDGQPAAKHWNLARCRRADPTQARQLTRHGPQIHRGDFRHVARQFQSKKFFCHEPGVATRVPELTYLFPSRASSLP